ncbi:MAG TPA: hypothetical protein VNQ90_06555 [Chthoniobacteraceae bacterium]|nr:hypothetical protein [Chthoniobacteraceae bacterium]
MKRRHSAVAPGFSQVELLVTVIIVLVIASLAFPVFSRMKAGSQSVACIGKLKFLWQCWDVYRKETRQRLYTGANSWMYDMVDARAITSGETTVCPATSANSKDVYFYPVPYSSRIGRITYWSGPPPRPIGYSVNNWVFYASGGITSSRQFSKHTSTPLFMDGTVYGLAAGAWNDPDLRVKRIAFRHLGSANFIFLDGHAESLTPAQVKLLDPKPL